MDFPIKEILKGYKLPPQTKGRILNKHQRLALEIIEFFKVEKKYQGRWFRACKNCPAFVEDKFRICKEKKKPASYLWRMIFKNKICEVAKKGIIKEIPVKQNL